MNTTSTQITAEALKPSNFNAETSTRLTQKCANGHTITRSRDGQLVFTSPRGVSGYSAHLDAAGQVYKQTLRKEVSLAGTKLIADIREYLAAEAA